MDALLFLSDDSDEETAQEQRTLAKGSLSEQGVGDSMCGSETEVSLPAAKRARPNGSETPNVPCVGFDTLQRIGYTPVELIQSAKYIQAASAEEERRVVQAVVLRETVSEEAEERQQGCARPPPAVEIRGTGPISLPWEQLHHADANRSGGFPPRLLTPLMERGFTAPTPIQAHSWPILLSGRDLIGIAKTGSGKTLAYLLPCFAQMQHVSDEQTSVLRLPMVLVLGPTRELVSQIEREAERFRRLADVTTVAVYGGAPKGPQLAGLRGHPKVIVATPGRLNDFLSTESAVCKLQGVRFLVLDEADRMLDDGFEPEIKKILAAAIYPQRQTMLFSATWPTSMRKVAAEMLRNPVEVRIGNVDELCANADVSQDVVFCSSEDEKERALLRILKERHRPRTIVFVSTKRTCRNLARSIRCAVPGRCEELHGDRKQEEREAALQAFRVGDVRVLFATDVAGRGIDIPGVNLVVNFDPPRSAEDYVHRIGRTGRAGSTGHAISLLDPVRDGEAMHHVAEVMHQTGVLVPRELARRLQSTLPGVDLIVLPKRQGKLV